MKTITIAKGDGIGPEIMDATISVLKAAKADLNFEEIQVGEKVYLSGNTSGIDNSSWDAITKNKVFLKAPITTPQGGGYKSLNVTMRKTLGLYSNIRPCNSYHPFIETKHPVMDVVIIRENEEDLYAGIEHQQTDEVVQCLKLISRPGCEKIIRYAFEYAKAYGRKKVSCFTKDNIMKQTDGLFHAVFKEIAEEYPDIENEHWIIDIGSARLANNPEDFDVIVTLNLYGDVLSDIAAEISGSVGLGGSANIGAECAMFEAVHGSAPDIAGKDLANPSGLILASVLMLKHIGQSEVAKKIKDALLYTIEEGYHTGDIFKESISKKKVGTKEFTERLIQNLDKTPKKLVNNDKSQSLSLDLKPYKKRPKTDKKLKGVDVFVDWAGTDANTIGKMLESINGELSLVMITNRGVKVYPEGRKETFCTDHWRCRFQSPTNSEVTKSDIINLLQAAENNNIDIIKTENLYEFNGKRGYSLGQGQ